MLKVGYRNDSYAMVMLRKGKVNNIYFFSFFKGEEYFAIKMAVGKL